MDALLTLPQELLLGAIAVLDAIPDGARAALAAGFLIIFLRYFEQRIPGFEIQYGQSFRKTALVALLLIPAFVWLVPASRMTVFVEELEPAVADIHPVWIALLLTWLVGVLTALTALFRAQLRARREISPLPVIDDEKLTNRLAHWQRRLGLEWTVGMVEVPGTAPRFFASGSLIAFPAAARHWPGNLQDVILIVSLTHLKRRHLRWHRIGKTVSCIYWPVPWVRRLADNLIRDLQRSADRLAESCYRDRLGYDRALRQIAQRLETPGQMMPNGAASTGSSAPAHLEPLKMAGQAYGHSLSRLLHPVMEPPWQLAEILSERSEDNQLTWTDPYDRVVLFVGQAVFLAFLLTGTTLKERPPEVDYEYSFPFELFWKEHFHRNLELQEKVGPPPPP
ncbi:MAG: hypothetical protein EP301_07440 [Gammaproteobacteria bacterium]|nr:MAG: hypothetical protein EP301_07440 [Gammaproteobacteria bacterium]